MRPTTRLTLLFIALGIASVAQGQGLIPRTTAARYGLERAWFTQVGSPQATGRLQHVNYDEGMILLQSTGGKLTALDGETGRTLWSTQIGRGGAGSSEPVANDDYIVVLNGSTLYAVDRKDGRISWEKQVRGAPGAGPGVTATHAFVPMTTGLVEGYELSAGKTQTPWNFQSTGRVLFSPLTTESSVCWTTDLGHFYVADPNAKGIKYRLETQGAIHSRPAAWSPLLFATSIDGFTYAIEEKKGKIVWKRSIGRPIYTEPVAIKDRVFIIPEFGDMYCLDSKDGHVVWIAPEITQFVSASPTRVYGVDRVGRLAMLDLETGANLGNVPIGALSRKLLNTNSDRIYLVDDSNVMQCLHETQLNAPVLQTRPKVVTEDLTLQPKKRPATSDPSTPTDPPAADPDDAPTDATDNPFDFPSDSDADDPFGSP